MTRREFFVIAASATMWPVRVSAQQDTAMPRLAVVHPSTHVVEQSTTGPHQQWRAFFTELERSGFVEGKSLIVERYSGEGRSDRYAELAKGVVARRPDVIFTATVRLLWIFKNANET